MAHAHGDILRAVAKLAQAKGIPRVATFDLDRFDFYVVECEDGRPLRLRAREVLEMAEECRKEREAADGV